MINFRILASVAIACAAMATPALAQQAIQEPGAYAFYQSNRAYGAPFQYSDRDASRSSFAFARGHSFRSGGHHQTR